MGIEHEAKDDRLGCILVPIGLLVVSIAGTWLFMKVLASALHPDPQAISSVTGTEPSPQWSEAVNRARRSIRASLAEQNLPGLSVAVGAGGSMVWAEGFGWAHIETRMPVTPDTRFRIGTASTVLTSAAAGVLLEKVAPVVDEAGTPRRIISGTPALPMAAAVAGDDPQTAANIPQARMFAITSPPGTRASHRYIDS